MKTAETPHPTTPGSWHIAYCMDDCDESWVLDEADFDPPLTMNEVGATFALIIEDHICPEAHR